MMLQCHKYCCNTVGHCFHTIQLLLCCSFVVPLEKMPFDGNILHLLASASVGTLFGILCNKAGLLFTEHPDTPRNSILKPVVLALMNTLRSMDNFTDVSMIRHLILQACFWSSTLF
jgi:hypothetical protein